MSKNKGQAITKNMIFRSGRGSTEVCGTTLFLAIGFVFTCIVAMFSALLSFFGFNDYVKSSGSIVVVNAPSSFIKFTESEPSDSKIYYEQFDAPFDFLAMSEFMHKNAAGVVIFFPDDFDEQIISGANADILTYYRTDSTDYKYIRDLVRDGYLEDYRTFLIDRFDIPDTSNTWEVISADIPTAQNETFATHFARSMGNNFIPILLFITLMYSGMSTGTEAISGQKERGTFSRILLTPVPRKNIIISFTKGVFISSMIPALIVLIISFLIPPYRHPESVIPALILAVSLAFFISAITVLISVMNDSVTSAQTAFLPIFFIILTILVTCINGEESSRDVYSWLPVYGQFYGFGNAFNGTVDILPALICSVLTVMLGAAVVYVSSVLLKNEKFTVRTVSSEDENEVKAPGPLSKAGDIITGFIDVIIYPMVTLSIFQLIAMIPVVISYMRDPSYSEFIADLSEVTSVPDIINKTMEIINIFMSDPKFLGLMSVSYILIIIACIIRTRGTVSVTTPGDLFPSYLKGAVSGALMMTFVYIFLIITHKAVPGGFGLNKENIMIFAFSVLMWIPQGSAEEFLFRRFMIDRITAIMPAYKNATAVIVSSVLFSLFHGFNGGFSLTALINIFLLAVLFALIYIDTGNILITCACHTMWNLFQGSIFGLSVSGNSETASLISTTYTGSAFGPEGTWEASVIIAVCLIFYLLIRQRIIRAPKKS